MPLVLVLLFIVVPLAEVWVIIRVADGAGWMNTIALLFIVSIIGAFLVRREGARAWSAFTSALAQSRIPATEVVDGALVLVGGALMLTPGFLTDGVGLLLVVPPTRALVNRALRARVRGMFGLGGVGRVAEYGSNRAQTQGKTQGRMPHRDDPDVVDIEIVDVQRESDAPPKPEDN